MQNFEGLSLQKNKFGGLYVNGQPVCAFFKKQIVSLHKLGFNDQQICERMHASLNTVKRTRAAYRQLGRVPPCPMRRVLTMVIRYRVLELKETNPSFTMERIQHELLDEYSYIVEVVPNLHGIGRILAAGRTCPTHPEGPILTDCDQTCLYDYHFLIDE